MGFNATKLLLRATTIPVLTMFIFNFMYKNDRN